VIARAGIISMIRKRMFLVLLLGGWIQFIVRAVMVYFAIYYPQMAGSFVDASMYRAFLGFWFQELVYFAVTIYVGAGLIANDRRANALQIYLSKPLTRFEYIGGKAAVLFAFLMLVSWLPAMLLLLLHVLFQGSFTFLTSNLYLLPAITVAASLQALLMTFVMLALSSLSKSSRYVGILYAGIIFFTQSIYGVMSAITGSTSMSWMSVSASITQVVDVIFRQAPRYTTPWQVSLVVVLGLIALSLSVLERRVRGVEIVT
jgi:ABC-2 type transport system permease protein